MKAFDSRAPSNSDVAPTKPTFLSFPRFSPRVAVAICGAYAQLVQAALSRAREAVAAGIITPEVSAGVPLTIPIEGCAAASTTNTGANSTLSQFPPSKPAVGQCVLRPSWALPLAAIDINYGACKRCKCRNLHRIAGARKDARGWLATVSRLRPRISR
jgi:hypothetical protein